MQATFDFIESAPPVPTEDDFSITEGLAYMQRGLSAAYDFSDFIYVTELPATFTGGQTNEIKSFKKGLAEIYKETLPKNLIPTKTYLKKITSEQLVTVSFDVELWNRLNINNVDSFKPSWTLPVEKRHNKVAQGFPQRKKDFYKFNMKMLFQIKKCKRGDNQLSMKIQDLLSDHNIKFYSVQGDSQQFCGVYNAVIGGRFNDGLQKPKDPYNFFLHCLIGYDKPQHVGGSYLVVQKCIFDWMNIHMSHESLNQVMGRNDIKNGSSIFSQHHCPRSHIKLSRIKDDQGNPVTMHRQSKGFTTSKFDGVANRDSSDNITPEQGLFFLAYHKDPIIIQKMLINQMGNNNNPSFDDGLLNHFHTQHGNILYVPNIFQITGLSLKTPDINPTISQLCQYHQTRWLKHYQRNEVDQESYKKTGNPYYLYSRAGYMKKMTYSHEYDKQLHPPSPRIMRLLSRTFSLWQDTWYYDRSQRQFPHLTEWVKNRPDVLQQISKKAGFDFKQYKKYQDYPMAIRNGLALHFNLGHIVSTKQYGCRGPSSCPKGKFGSNTFHLEPEDILVGGGPNLTFGQGKHLVQYLTFDEMKSGWMRGQNLSSHSGIGHVNPYVQQILEIGLDKLIGEFQKKADQYKGKDTAKYNLFIASVFSLLGMQKYFLNFSQLAQQHINKLGPKQAASKKSFERLRDTMAHLAHYPPAPVDIKTADPQVALKSLHQGLQMILSVYTCNQLTGEPISIGRLDYALRKFATPVSETNYEPSQELQDMMDAFWLKICEKANFNKGFFEDHQKWGNLALGGNSGSYPQGASFNQWGQQVVVGGLNPDNTPFHNAITVACLRAGRRMPVNAPCLSLRLHKNTPEFLIHEATKTILSGGAHPVLINDEKVIAGLERSGNYVIKKQLWQKDPLVVDGKTVTVPYQNWNPSIKHQDLYDFGSDGCHEFIPIGKSWLWLGGGNMMQPLQYILNEGKNLISSGPRYIHGQRLTYRCKKLEEYKSYQEIQKEYFQIFEQTMQRGLGGMLMNYSNMSKICPATLLNAFTADMRKRESDFYQNGASYRCFAPQYSAVANFVNSLWNIKTLVFQQKLTTLQQVRHALLLNWGDQMQEPFISRNLPPMLKVRQKQRFELLRQFSWRQPKFGLDPQVTAFGLYLARRMSLITRKIFEQPTPSMLNTLKTLTYRYGTKDAPFGFQYIPGSATFAGFCDVGVGIGASFDGRKKGQPVADDFSPQNFLMDLQVDNTRFRADPQYLQDIIKNYTYEPVKIKPQKVDINHFYNKDPQLFSGCPLDVNIDENYDPDILAHNIYQISQGAGPNCVTISVGARWLLEDARTNTDLDLIRFRMGGWSQFAIALFPHLLEHHIRRVRSIAKKVEKPVLKKIDERKKQDKKQQEKKH